MTRLSCTLAGLAATAACAGCSDDAPGDVDAAVDAAPDGPDVDAPDAGPCGDDLLFTGAYEDWDSTPQRFRGIAGATVTEAGNPGSPATTAPNGRSTLCVPSTAPSLVTYEKDGYLTARYTVDPAAVRGAYEVHGITPARVVTFHQELGAAWDAGAALVAIEVRGTDGGLVPGVAVALPGHPAGAGHHRTSAGDWEAGATTGDGGAHVAHLNVAIPEGPGEVALTVVPPAGRSCHAPDAVRVAAGEVALTTVWCD